MVKSCFGKLGMGERLMSEPSTLLDVFNLHQEMEINSVVTTAVVQELIIMAYNAGKYTATAELETRIQELEHDMRCHTHDWK